MTFALTKIQAYGIEAEEVVNKRYGQRVILSITAAATDTAWDFGNFSGTFWTAVGGTEPGATALKAFKDIQIRALSYILGDGSSIGGKSQISSVSALSTLDSGASAGGATTEALTVTGLAKTDAILAVTQQTKGANATALVSFESAASTTDKLTVGWTANPGAGAIVRVLRRAAAASTTPSAGQYVIVMDSTNTNIPSFTFASGDAPTALQLDLEWVLKEQETPVAVVKTA